MPSYTLHYLAGRAIGEVSRQLFELAGKPYTDKRYAKEEFPNHKSKFPFGQVPVLEVDGKQIPQSFAIARYLANEFGFAGKNSYDRAWVDALADQMKDYLTEMREFILVAFGIKEGDVKKVRAEIGEPARDKFYKIMEERLKTNKSGFLVGDSVTWVDLLLADHVDVIQNIVPGFLDGFPKVLAHKTRIQAIPQIKAWIAKRPKTPY